MSPNHALLYQTSSKKLQFVHAEKILGRIAVNEGDYVIDIGCGTGNLAKLLGTKVGISGKVVGIDPSKERIDVAKESCKPYNNIEFQICKSDQIKYPANQYNYAISIFVFHWIPADEKIQTIRLIYDCLKKGGEFCGITCSSIPCGNVNLFFDRCSDHAEGFKEAVKSTFHVNDAQWLKEQLQKAGFECVYFKEYVSCDGIGSTDKYIDWLVGTYSEQIGERFNLRDLWTKMEGDKMHWEQCDDGIALSCKVTEFTVRKP